MKINELQDRLFELDDRIRDDPSNKPLKEEHASVCGALYKHAVVSRILSGVGAVYEDATLDNWHVFSEPHKARLKQFRRYIMSVKEGRNKGLGLLLHGIAGDGKTHAAIGILRELITSRRRGVFVDMTELASELQQEYKDAEADEMFCGDVIESLRHTPIALLDDVGSERTTEDTRSKFSAVLHTRYRKGLITLITSNLDWPGQFDERYGPQITSRLSQMCEPFAMPEVDYRQLPRKKKEEIETNAQDKRN